MARLTRLDGGEIRALADVFGLGPVTGSGEVAAGTINSNYWFEGGGARWFLRVNEGKSEEDVRWEAAVLDELAARGVVTPRPRRSVDGAPLVACRGRWVSVFPWTRGVHREAGKVTLEDARELGAELARLHLAGAGIAHRFARSGIYTTQHIAARYRALLADPRAAGDPALAPVLEAAGEELTELAARSEERARAPSGLIHGDLFRDNVLFGDRGRIAALLDFEQASSGAWVYDLAVCLNAWCFTETLELDSGRIAQMIAGYRTERLLEPAELVLLPVEVRAAAVRFLVTRVTDVYLPGAEAPGKEFSRYLTRLRTWREIGAAGLRDRAGV